uniref:Uncharacterized protein n=1 Tax=Acrobeloides nanus TaxID=290746 RepID=A0A914C828_9BILA
MYELGCETENGNLLSPNPKKTRYTRRRSIVKPKYPSVSFIPLIVCVSVIVIFTLLLVLTVMLFGGCYFN